MGRPPCLTLVGANGSPASPSIPPTPRSAVPSPKLLFHVCDTDDHITNTLARWMVNGAEREDSHANVANTAGNTNLDKVIKYTLNYISNVKNRDRRLAVAFIVQNKPEPIILESVEQLRQKAACVCKQEGLFRSQVDIRLVIVSDIQNQTPIGSPLKRRFL